MAGKYITPKELTERAKELRIHGKQIGFVNGDFTLVRRTLIRNFRRVKGDETVCVAIVSSDRFLKSKGQKEEIWIDQKGRIKMLTALEGVDYVVVINNRPEYDSLISDIKPDIIES